MSEQLISINTAASNGISRLRRSIWSNKYDHLKIDLVNGRPGPWVHLFSPMNNWMNKRDPVTIPGFQIDYDSADWLPYEGCADDSDEYKAEAAKFNEAVAAQR